MDKKECGALLRMVEQEIDTSALRAEYLRGYRRGIEVHSSGVSDETAEEHRRFIDISEAGSGDPYLDTFVRGYRHGFEGISPESPSSTSFLSYRSLQIAAIS